MLFHRGSLTFGILLHYITLHYIKKNFKWPKIVKLLGPLACNSQTKENDRRKSTVFRRLRKTARDGAVVTSSGRVFQTLAAATAKVLSPTVDSRHRGMASRIMSTLNIYKIYVSIIRNI